MNESNIYEEIKEATNYIKTKKRDIFHKNEELGSKN